MIKVSWRKPILNGKIMVSTAIIKNHKDRFLLYQHSKMAESIGMWTLLDSLENAQHILFGENIKQAKLKAAVRIREILDKEIK